MLRYILYFEPGNVSEAMGTAELLPCCAIGYNVRTLRDP